MKADVARLGAKARAAKGWWPAWKWLVLRRSSQLLFLALFLAGPWFGVWIVKGTLASSLTLDVLPLTDPYVFLQSLAARHVPEATALTGALIVLAAYLVVGGRTYCGWVCPVNLVTDGAQWLRRRFRLRTVTAYRRTARYWILAATLIASFATGVIAWELVNPVSLLHRGLLFGMGAGWLVIAGIFLFDLFVANHGWCGHLCPVGAFYSTLGRAALVRVAAPRRDACDDCMECLAVCPEPQVIPPAIKGGPKGASDVIRSGECSNCGRCVDVCPQNVFEFGTRFRSQAEAVP
jgi:ferredoxin-type protein NapH